MYRGNEPIEIIVGGLYSSLQENGTFRIVKVLVADEDAVHLRMYAEKFTEVPADISSASLSLGSIGGGAFGIGHYPIARKGFFVNEKRLLRRETVAEDELEGYRIWASDDDA
jgi:hypothetical protein